jgi:predicted RND superfamily exporter protein
MLTLLLDNYFATNNSKITYAKTIILWYFTRADTPIAKQRLKEVSLDLFKLGQAGEYLDNVRFEIFGDEVANAEMVRGAIEATLLMTIGFFLLLIFVTFTVYRKMREMSKTSVPIIVFTAVLCPFLGSFAAFGLCTLLNFKIYTIMCVSPFLVQGVGVGK